MAFTGRTTAMREKWDEIADYLVATKKSNKPHGSLTGASRKFGINRSTIGNWVRNEPLFRRKLDQAEARLGEARREEIKAGEGSYIDKLVKIEHMLADAIYEDVLNGKIAPDKKAAVLRDVVHVSQLKQGKPTDIIETLSEMEGPELDEELRRAMRELRHSESTLMAEEARILREQLALLEGEAN